MRPLPRFILYFGSNSPGSTSRHRADALRRLGCEVLVVDPQSLIGRRSRWQSFLDYRTGYLCLQRRLLRLLISRVSGLMPHPDLVWVNGGELLGPSVIKWLRLIFACKIILYQNDDPTGLRDGNRFLCLQAALSFYDLCAFVRPESALEALAMGARRVLRVYMSYDEVLHAPVQLDQQHASKPPRRVVSFIGTLIPREPRDQFLAALVQAGLPLRLIGNSWQRSPLWPLLQLIFEGPGRTGFAYSRSLHDAAVSLGFLSHQNRDLMTQRSVEIPACGGLLCAERTSEHQLLYEEGQEAVFWDSVEECILQCNRILDNPDLRHQICVNSLAQVRNTGLGNEDICSYILASL
jgi:spore maturation protein CgeB